MYEQNQEYSERVKSCRRKLKNSASVPSVSILHELAEEFQLDGGSWVICSKSRVEDENKVFPTISSDEQRLAAKNTFLEIMGVLKREQIPASAFKSLRWIAHSNGQFSTELMNNYSNYLSNFVKDSSKCELWYFSYDNEVKLVYRLLIKQECVELEKHELFYQPEVVAISKIRREPSVSNDIWCFYGRLKPEDMMHITEEALSEAEKLSSRRFGDTTTNKQEETPKTRKQVLSKAFGCIQV